MEMTNELKYILNENDRLKSEYEDIGKFTDCCQSFKEGIVQYCNHLKVKLHNFVNTVNKMLIYKKFTIIKIIFLLLNFKNQKFILII